MRHTSAGAPAARPTITQDATYNALKQLNVHLGRDDQQALSAFFRDRINEKTREVQLLQLLEQVGLKAQTIGATGAKQIM